MERKVSTRSRPKAADNTSINTVPTRSRPKAAVKQLADDRGFIVVSTRSRPKAAEHLPT